MIKAEVGLKILQTVLGEMDTHFSHWNKHHLEHKYKYI